MQVAGFRSKQNFRRTRRAGTQRCPLSPQGATAQAPWFMNTKQITASGTGPFILFTPDEASHAVILQILEILDHAHSVVGPVPFIELLQTSTGNVVACGAVFHPATLPLFTGFDAAKHAGLRFPAVLCLTARTGVGQPHIGPAQSAVHSARRDQGRAHPLFSCRSGSYH